MNFRVLLAGGVAPLALASHGVYAAEAPATITNAAVPAPEDAQTTSVGTGASDSGEIVVTARRRQETAQDVPLAISVVGGEHIDNTGAFNVGRLQQLTPTLQFYSSNPRNTAVNIRGLGGPGGFGGRDHLARLGLLGSLGYLGDLRSFGSLGSLGSLGGLASLGGPVPLPGY